MEKKYHEVKKEYLKTGFFLRMIPIELDPAEGRARETGHSISMANKRGEKSF